jgi:hypothetical protein
MQILVTWMSIRLLCRGYILIALSIEGVICALGERVTASGHIHGEHAEQAAIRGGGGQTTSLVIQLPLGPGSSPISKLLTHALTYLLTILGGIASLS